MNICKVVGECTLIYNDTKIMSVNLFVVDISARLNDSIDDWLKLFSTERQKKILSYRFNADRNRTIWAELLVRYVVSEKFSRPLEKVQVYRDARGKPHIADLPAEISLSHAGNWVICSVGTISSGVDVEVDSTDALEIARNFFLRGEFEKIASLPENLQRRQFLTYWTLKESYFKLTGDFFSLKCGGEKLFLGVPHEHRFATKDGIFLEELNGEKVLLYSKIGFWYHLCLQKAPNAKFLMQSERDVFKELVEVSPFLSFTTDVLIKTGQRAKKLYL